MDRRQHRSVACSHVGLVRRHNEDAYLERSDLGLWVVADGMGGMTAGDVASSTIVGSLGDIADAPDWRAVLAQVSSRMAAVNHELLRLAETRGPSTVIGSTVAGLVMRADQVACFWAGDSRVYRHRSGQLQRLTHDHSLVQEMVDAGLLQEHQAENHPRSNVVSRAVGADSTLELEYAYTQVEAGDIYLVCSDGLTRMVTDPELAVELGRRPIGQTSETLLALVLQRGARDNVTFILIECLL